MPGIFNIFFKRLFGVEIKTSIVYNESVGKVNKIKKFLKKPAATVIAALLVIALVLAAYFIYEYIFKDDYRDDLDSGETPSVKQTGDVVLSGNIVETHFIDVGQGDCILIRFYDGIDVLIDAGSGSGRNPSSAVVSSTLAYLEADGLDAIDYFIITHPHSDHMNMADEILSAYEVRNVWYNGYEATQAFVTEDFLPALASENAALTLFDGDGEDYVLATADYRLTIYSPGCERFSNVNYMSPFVLLEYAGVKTLFTGDAEYTSQQWFMERFEEFLDIDVLKVGHHGSATSCKTEWLSFLTPEYAVISVAESNTYGHPTEVALNNLNASGAITFRTSYQGAIILLSDGSGNFGFRTQKDVPPENVKDGVAVPFIK